MTALLEATELAKAFPTRRNLLGRVTAWEQAVNGVSFQLQPGATLGLVGETGAGKSTVGRLVLRLLESDHGTINLLGHDVRALGSKQLRRLRRRAQMIFQDPFASLDPRMVVGDAVAEPLLLHDRLGRDERDRQVLELFHRVGLEADHTDRYPHEFSGGQLQRVAIARALATGPDLIVCDEPVAALDVSIQAQVLNLLLDLQAERGISYLFISHDLSLVKTFAHDVAVMNHGEIVEMGPSADIFDNPQQPYTKDLVSAIPRIAHLHQRTSPASVPASSLEKRIE